MNMCFHSQLKPVSLGCRHMGIAVAKVSEREVGLICAKTQVTNDNKQRDKYSKPLEQSRVRCMHFSKVGQTWCVAGEILPRSVVCRCVGSGLRGENPKAIYGWPTTAELSSRPLLLHKGLAVRRL